MLIRQLFRNISALLIAYGLGAAAQAAQTDISTEPLNTYSAPSSTDVKPNVLFVLDDSGSMNWDFMPDWACSPLSLPNPSCSSTGQDPSSPRYEYLFRNAAYNGIYYNPAITYVPPVAVTTTGALNTTKYVSMTGTSTATGGDVNATSSSPNWKYVKNEFTGVQSSDRSDLQSDYTKPPYFFTTIAGEYCDSPSFKNCISATAPSTAYPYPAKVKWCNSSALTNCRAAFSNSYSWVRSPSPSLATVTVSAPTSAVVSGITVNGKQIMSASTGTYSAVSRWDDGSSGLADDIVTQINKCTIAIPAAPTNCTVAGYHAYQSGGVVTIIAPSAVTYTPSVSKSGTLTVDIKAFATNGVPGTVIPTVIKSSVNSYPYPGSATKASTRTDCAGTTCTYKEEMTNYANWWIYYRTRMQMMKTAASIAFSTIDSATDLANGVSRFRLGYMSINDNTTHDFLNLGEFAGTQKYNWYAKLFAASPGNSTPLRAALSTAGQLYAGRLASLNGSDVVDPLQYSCQQNYTILSTDGFWNEGSGYYKLDGATNVGNQDGLLSRPYYDGASSQIQSRTSTLQKRAIDTQTRTDTLQKRTGHLQKRTKSGRNWSSWSDATSCDPSSSVDCQYNWSGWTNVVSSCTPSYSSGSGNWTIVNGTDCQYTPSSWTSVTSCTPVDPPTSAPYTQLTATECQVVATGSWVPASSCTATNKVQCGYTDWSSWSNASSCTAVPQSTTSPYTVSTAKECQTVTSGGTSNTLADVAAYYYNTDLRSSTDNTDLLSSGSRDSNTTGTCTGPVISPSTTANDLCANNVPANGRDVATSQHMTTFTLGLGSQGQMIYAPNDGKNYWNDSSGDFYDVKNGTSANTTSGICSWQSSGVCNWPTPVSNSNANIDDLWHAAVNGHGSYFSATDPSSLATSLTNTLSTIINTPRPGTAAAAASSNPNVSAADNYVFSSSYKSVEWYGELVRQQITDAGVLTAENWSAMRLLDCTTTPWQASHSYTAGDVYRQGTKCYVVNTDYISGSSFDSSTSGADISNTSVLNADETAAVTTPVTAQTSRTIYTKGTSTSGLIPFQWDDLQTAGLSSYFTTPYITYTSSTSGLSQFCSSGGNCLSGSAQSNNTIATGGAAGEALVNFLRGDRTYEGTYFRQRIHVLGDIVSSEARYVQKPLFDYADAGYSDFKSLQASRTGAVYVGSNDGMVHAFSASTGQEMWAYVPSMVLPNMYMLADKNYSTKHEFLVDGTPETGDICPSSSCSGSQWKTILVGGMNRGGMGYYALDITDPASPKLLWEFTNSSLDHSTQGYLGYAYSNPRIVKLKNGTWVVAIASGYNNSDGGGHLYILNANTGSVINVINTGVGTSDSPSGLARLSAHVLEPMTDNTATAMYGGDLFGNLWRFDVNGDIGAPGTDAQSLVAFKDPSGGAQPITVKPLEATINGHPVVFAGTGRYLGTSDVGNTTTGKQTESFYAVMDKLDTTTYADPHSNSAFVQQVLQSTTCPQGSTVCTPGQIVRTSTSNAVDWTTKNGWYIDFLTGGERSVTDPALGLGTLLFTTITPQSSSVSACGSSSGDTSASFLYALDYLTGGPVSVSTGEANGLNTVSGTSLGSGLATRPVMIEQSDGTVRALVRTSGGTTSSSSSTDLGSTVVATPPVTPPSSGAPRRVSWRELPTSN